MDGHSLALVLLVAMFSYQIASIAATWQIYRIEETLFHLATEFLWVRIGQGVRKNRLSGKWGDMSWLSVERYDLYNRKPSIAEDVFI